MLSHHLHVVIGEKNSHKTVSYLSVLNTVFFFGLKDGGKNEW